MVLQSPIGLDRLMSEDRPDPSAPCAREMQVALQDANGAWPHPLADAAGSARAVGRRFAPNAGQAIRSSLASSPIGRTARRSWATFVARLGTASTGSPARMPCCRRPPSPARPKVGDAVEAATITLAALTAWRALVVNAKLEAGDMVYCSARAASRSALQIAS